MELPLDREDVDAFLTGLFDANRKLDEIRSSWRPMARKRKRTILTPEERERRARTMRLLEERIAYHERKLAEERAAAEAKPEP